MPSRKVVYSVGASLDGYIASPDGSYEWLERAAKRAEGDDFGMNDFFKTIDTVIMGRKTWEVARAHGMAETGFANMRNYVFSRTLPKGVRHGVEFVSGDPRAFVARLKRRRGKDIWLCGGGEVAREFLKRGAIDEIGVGIVPMLIGSGRPTFPPGFDDVRLELKESRRYGGDVVVLIYRVLHRRRRSPPTRKSVGKRSARRRAKSR